MTPRSKVTKLDPAQFPEAPEVEDVGLSSEGPAYVCLSLSTGEDVSARPEDLTVYRTPEGLPVWVEVGGREADPEDPEDAGEDGDLYRLPAPLAHLFAWAVRGWPEARAASKVRAAHFYLSRVLEDPDGDSAAYYLQHAALNALSAGTGWPGEEEKPEESQHA